MTLSNGQARPHNLVHLNRDTGYRHRNQDPRLVDITKKITDSGWELSFIAERSGVSVSTLRSWVKGETLHPYNMTMDAVYQALGYTRVLVTISSNASVRRH
jgi:lambda repressor-like predicted transcriptional regulator